MTLDLDGMLALLSEYLEDLKKRVHPPALMLGWLNIGQDKIVPLLNRCQISEADIYVGDAVLYGDGSLDLSSLATAPANLANSLERVRIKDGKFFSKISLQEWARLKNKSHVFTTLEPKFYPRGTKIMCEPFSADDVATGSIVADTVYVNYGYTTVTYNSTDYDDGQSFTGVADVTTYTTSGTGLVIAAQEIELWYTRRPTQMTFDLANVDIPSGNIEAGVIYVNIGYTEVIYSTDRYTNGRPFLGYEGVTTYTTDGSGIVAVANLGQVEAGCEFQSIAVREIIVKLAASVGWGTIKEGLIRSREFYQTAVNDIEQLNLLSSGTDSVAEDQVPGEDVQVVGDVRFNLTD